jgi:hypothetical protein
MKRISTGSMKVLCDKKVYVGVDVHKESWHVTVRIDGEEGTSGVKSLSLIVPRSSDTVSYVPTSPHPVSGRLLPCYLQR